MGQTLEKAKTVVKPPRNGKKNVLEFLVVLSPEDFDRRCCCMTKVGFVRKQLSGLPGKLHVGNMGEADKTCQCCPDTYPIQGIIMPNELYILLPKEGIYVLESIWEHEYLKSQIQELTEVFRKLGATHVNYAVSQSDTSDASLKMGASASVAGMDLRTSTEFSRENSNSTNLKSAINYRTNHATYTTLEQFLKDDGLYYLKTQPDWVKFVREKLEGKATHMDFEFAFNKTIKYSASLAANFKAAGINCGATSNNAQAINIKFEIEFASGSPVASTAPPSALKKVTSIPSRPPPEPPKALTPRSVLVSVS